MNRQKLFARQISRLIEKLKKKYFHYHQYLGKFISRNFRVCEFFLQALEKHTFFCHISPNQKNFLDPGLAKPQSQLNPGLKNTDLV